MTSNKEAISQRAMEIYLNSKSSITLEQAFQKAEKEAQLVNAIPKDIKDLFGGIFK